MTHPILRQKLTPPRPWAGVIARPRLEGWLDAAFERGAHVGVFAGTGYGKTALLAAWARRHGAAWLTLDAEDADLDVTLTYLITAFESALPGFQTEARDLLGRAREREGAFATLSALLADLDEQCERPLALVIDDYHLAASPSLDALVSRMLRYLPPMIRLVLASRKPPEVELAMLQARGSLEVLDERGLAFDLAELGELRPAVEPQGLMSATGGWPAAMGLTPELLDAFLEEQLLASLPADVRAFLQRVAVVETFDAALCEEALAEPFTRDRRDHLVRERLIFNRGAERYALQPAVRNLLARRFQVEVPRDERLALLRRVGDHFWRTGQASTALRYWGEAGEGDLAAEHLAQVADAWLAAGRLDALANAIAQLGTAAERPAFLFYAAELHRRWGDFAKADALFERALAGDPEAAIATRARLGQAQLAAARGNVAAARGCLAQLGPVAGPLALDVAILEGGLALLSGETDRAIGGYEGALALARRLQDASGEARATHNLGICFIRTGEFEQALACYDRAIAATAADGTPLVWMAPINRALVLVHLDHPSEAAVAAEAALELVRRYGLTREEGYALRILGFAQLRRGSRDAAAASFLAAEHLARRANDTLGLAYSLNFRAELALAGGNPEAAQGLTEEVDRVMGGRDAAGGVLDFAQTRAKVALAQGRGEEARQQVAGLLAKARALGYVQLAKEMEQLVSPEAPAAPAVPPRDEPAPALSVRCFGVFRASRAGTPITDRDWQTARAKQLFAFLLFTPEGATKERLLETVFPGEEVSNDLMNMSLMRLRKALEPDLEKGRPSRFILRADGRYLFNRQAHVEVDADAFEAAIRAARPEGSPGELEALERALALYQGEFMPELDEPWVVAVRLRLQEAALGVCRRLLAVYDEARPAEAARVLRRALEVDPASEEFNREIILRHLEAGEPHLARAQYQLCERHYQEVLGTEPPADLAVLVALPGEPKR